MKRITFSILILVILSFTSIACANIHGKENPAIFADMQNNPSKYIACGSIGMGLSYHLDKSSIRVDKYAPPIYIIAFRVISHKSPENYTYEEWVRYYYDYTSRKIYREIYFKKSSDDVGKPQWDYIDIHLLNDKRMGSSNRAGLLSWIAEGEIAFYLAYDMSFFDNPITQVFKEYINKN